MSPSMLPQNKIGYLPSQITTQSDARPICSDSVSGLITLQDRQPRMCTSLLAVQHMDLMPKRLKQAPSAKKKPSNAKRALSTSSFFSRELRLKSDRDLQSPSRKGKYLRRGSKTASMLVQGSCGYSDTAISLAASVGTCVTESSEGTSSFDWSGPDEHTAQRNWSSMPSTQLSEPLYRGVPITGRTPPDGLSSVVPPFPQSFKRISISSDNVPITSRAPPDGLSSVIPLLSQSFNGIEISGGDEKAPSEVSVVTEQSTAATGSPGQTGAIAWRSDVK